MSKNPLRRGLGPVLLLFCLNAGLSACTLSHLPKPGAEEPMTGDNLNAEGAVPLSDGESTWRRGDKLYVASDRLRLRAGPEVEESNILSVLAKGAEVVVLESTTLDSEFVKIFVQSSQEQTQNSGGAEISMGYVGKRYLTRVSPRRLPYFIIQNIASATTRVYEKCQSSAPCTHRLVLQMKNVVGENTAEKRTLLGSYKITDWFKFYEDSDRRYPSWYMPGYPTLPKVDSPLGSWFEKKFMPHGFGEIRGGFGWFAAYIGPNADAQWLHGTFGWGAQKDLPLRNTSSHGCTRFDNESIAYLHHLIQEGTPVLRIYAEEDIPANTADPGAKKSTWSYILTSDQAQASHPRSIDRQEVLERQVPPSQWLEVGTYLIQDQASVPDESNIYQLARSSLRGIYDVEHGLLVDYQHPSELQVGGYQDVLIPRELISNYRIRTITKSK